MTAGKGLPEWIFSAYGPGKNAPRQLFGGPQREQSFEEMRLRHYDLAAQGNIQVAVQEAQALYAECLKQGQVILNDLAGAVKYILDGDNEHPNRIDIVTSKSGGPGFGQAPAQPSQPSQSSAFGQPSGLGGAQPAFGKQAFGQPSFGQPGFNQLSAPAQPSFGQPSAPGSAFGQPSALGQQNAFGQPSGLGAQPAFGQPSFGQPSQPKPAFGQPSFGQPAFGQPSAPASAPFGQPSAASPFAQMRNENQQPTAFGQPSQPTPSPFGQPSGQPAAPTGFSQPSQPAPGPFGQPSQTPFGAPQQPQPQQPQQQPFGQQPAPSGFGQLAQPPQPPQPAEDGKRPPFIKTDSGELNPFPHMTGQTIRDPMSKRLTMWKGQPVKYINDWPCYLHPQDRQTFVRIHFPDGPPEPASLRDAQGKPEEYTAEVNEQYEYFFSNGYFKDGVIPPVPPKSEWVSFDF